MINNNSNTNKNIKSKIIYYIIFMINAKQNNSSDKLMVNAKIQIIKKI